MSPWIISRREDLLWFHGSVVAGLVLLALFALLPPLSDSTYAADHPAVLLLLLWGVLFDGTHVLGTYARTYLAPDAASRSALPGSWSWLLIALGPVLAVIDALFLPQMPSLLGHAGWLFRHFLLLAYLWAYWHLVRQHYGILVLYERRVQPADLKALRLDAAILWLGCLYPYMRFALSEGYLYSGLPQLLPRVWLPTLRAGLDLSCAAVGLGLLLLLARRFVGQRLRPGPRELLLLIVISFHLLVFALLDNLLTITATLTIFHNFQYHRVVWQYERGKGRVPMGSLVAYLGWGVLLGLLWYGPRVMGVALLAPSLLRNMLLGLGWGVALHHYLVDGRIWRVRRTPAVAQTLDQGARLCA